MKTAIIFGSSGLIGNEFGTVTGRKRRCGWLDLVLLKQSADICGIHGIAWNGKQ